MSTVVIQCVAATDGIAVAPCGTFAGVALTPVMLDLDAPALDYSGLGQLFSWVLTFVLVTFVIGLTVGAIMRVIKSA